MTQLRWSKPGANIWISDEIRIPIGERRHRAIFRIDGRNRAREGYRVDRGGIMGWEAIDSGEGFRSVANAKRHVQAFIEEVIAQETLTPSGTGWQQAARGPLVPTSSRDRARASARISFAEANRVRRQKGRRPLTRAQYAYARRFGQPVTIYTPGRPKARRRRRYRGNFRA